MPLHLLFSSQFYSHMVKMESDGEELPPLLVDPKDGIQHPEDTSRIRVPITIVTGTKKPPNL
jgi:hypothetical protein